MIFNGLEKICLVDFSFHEFLPLYRFYYNLLKIVDLRSQNYKEEKNILLKQSSLKWQDT
jgi:hypothetical protein